MVKLLIASKNQKKYSELKKIIETLLAFDGKKLFELVSLNDFPLVEEVEEDGSTFEENAIKKAIGYARQTNLLTLADDSGISIDALDGEPGVHSARFAGPNKNDFDNCYKVLSLMEKVEEPKRTGRFECVIAIAEPGKIVGTAYGKVEGMILKEMRGRGGFGYDPIFYYPPFAKTLAQASSEEKNKVSHRGKALARAVDILRNFICKS